MGIHAGVGTGQTLCPWQPQFLDFQCFQHSLHSLISAWPVTDWKAPAFLPWVPPLSTPTDHRLSPSTQQLHVCLNTDGVSSSSPAFLQLLG